MRKAPRCSVANSLAAAVHWVGGSPTETHLQEDWLAGAVESSGITRDELDGMIKEGFVRKRRSPAGNEGFLLYSERQAVMAKELRATARYSDEELRHIFADWDSYLEIVTTDELAYDSFDVYDYDHFKRRAAEMV